MPWRSFSLHLYNHQLNHRFSLTLHVPPPPPQKWLIVILTSLVHMTHLLVTATWRFAFPSSMISMTSSGLETNLSLAP